MITYKPKQYGYPIEVFVDGKKTGEIRMLCGNYAYIPKSRTAKRGQLFSSIEAVKRDLEKP
jgi:hypothetical protein